MLHPLLLRIKDRDSYDSYALHTDTDVRDSQRAGLLLITLATSEDLASPRDPQQTFSAGGRAAPP